MKDVRDWEIEIQVISRNAREAAGSNRRAVISVQPRYDLLLLRLAARIVVVPDHFDGGVVGFRTGIREKSLRHISRRNRDQFLREHDGGFVTLVSEAMIIGKLAELLCCGRDQPLLPKTQRHAPKTG